MWLNHLTQRHFLCKTKKAPKVVQFMFSTLHLPHLQINHFQAVIHQLTDTLDQRIVIPWVMGQIDIQRMSMVDTHRSTTIGFQGIATDQQIGIRIVNPNSILLVIQCAILLLTRDILLTHDTHLHLTLAIQLILVILQIHDTHPIIDILQTLDILRIRDTHQTPVIHLTNHPLQTPDIHQCDQTHAIQVDHTIHYILWHRLVLATLLHICHKCIPTTKLVIHRLPEHHPSVVTPQIDILHL